jgi:hypothetical protein
LGGTAVLRLAGLLALALVALLALTAGSASAATHHVFETTFAGPGSGPGQLSDPSGVAVNEATGNIYVVDKGNDRVEIFSPAGTYVGFFDGSGASEFEGVPLAGTEAGAGGLPGETGGTGSLPGERGSPSGRFQEPEGIAVDNSCALQGLSEPKCKEEDPSNGDVYVVDAGFGHRVIDKYDAQGKYLGQLTEAGGGSLAEPFALDGVAVDVEGGVWVYREELPPLIYGFSNSQPNAFVKTVTLKGPVTHTARPGIAVDSQGDFYARYRDNELALHVAKLNPEGKVISEEVGKEESSAVAVEQASDQALVDNLSSIGVFDAQGTERERLGAGHLTASAGVGVNGAQGRIYAADPGAGDVAVFAPEPPAAPLVENESVSNVTALSAQLEAEIDPRSEVGEAPSEYHFQYGPCASIDPSSCAASPYQTITPLPDGQIEASFQTQSVNVKVKDLTAGTTYHFRVIARNSHGEGAPGREVTFTTEGAGGSLTLPDGRGWELVSPADKHGALIESPGFGVVQAAASGEGITYLANTPTEDQPEGYEALVQVLSRRASAGWSSRDVSIANAGATGFTIGARPEYKFFDRELSLGAVQPIGRFNAALSGEASEQTAFLRDLGETCASSCYHPLVSGKAGFANVPEGTQFGEEEQCIPTPTHASAAVCGPEFLGASDDLHHVVLRATVPLTQGAGERQLYEWSGGRLSLVSVLPSGEPVAGGDVEFGGLQGAARGAISDDGGRVVFRVPPTLSFFVRDTAREETVQVDKAACDEEEECESGGGAFQIASSDGSRIFFTDDHKLTADAGTRSGSKQKADLYECRLALSAGKLACVLTDLTPKQGEEGAEVQGGVLGAGEDGATIYFVAKGALAPGAVSGQANLYVHDASGTRLVARLAAGDSADWDENLTGQPTRVSASGRFLAFVSVASLSGYDNRLREGGQLASEVFTYDDSSGQLRCASCEPSGGRPAGRSSVPGWTSTGAGVFRRERYQPRYLSDQGRVFFNSSDALVPQDSNGRQDVYEYEAPGVGDCTQKLSTYSPRSGGCVALVSSGSSAQESTFMDASESGDDVFFLSAAKLSALDTDAAYDIYDAHVCTGSPCITSPPPRSPLCEGDACQLPVVPPNDSTPGSLTFNGAGNLQECPKGKAKKHGKCVKQRQPKKKHKKNHKKTGKHKRAASSTRRAGR